jgi:hypothetical protein
MGSSETSKMMGPTIHISDLKKQRFLMRDKSSPRLTSWYKYDFLRQVGKERL